jgi:hypothetical protein
MYEITHGKRHFNKQYLRKESELKTRGPSMYDWRINVLNVLDEHGKYIDMMEYLNTMVCALRGRTDRDDFTTTNLSDVIGALHREGVTRILAVDFTCSVIRRGAFGVEPREERRFFLQAIRSMRSTKGGGRNLANKRLRHTVRLT